MIRSASKNWRDVAVVTDSRLYSEIIEELNENDGSLSLETRQRLATLAYTRTASYDLAISSYLAKQLSNDDLDRLEPLNPLGHLAFIELEDEESPANESEPGAIATGSTPTPNELPEYRSIDLAKVTDLRYGENPHQRAAIYRSDDDSSGIAGAEQLHGKEMSFNNYVDAEAAWNLVQDFDDLAVAIIKHTNPSGVGTGNDNLEAYKRALATDPVSAFGGIVAFNQKVDAAVARSVIEVFSEVIVAPEYDDAALEIFRSKKNLRVLKVEPAAFESQISNLRSEISEASSSESQISDLKFQIWNTSRSLAASSYRTRTPIASDRRGPQHRHRPANRPKPNSTPCNSPGRSASTSNRTPSSLPTPTKPSASEPDR